MNKATIIVCVLAVGMSLALPSIAQAQTRSASVEGPYVGLGLGVTSFGLKKNDFTGATATSRTFDERDTGFKLFGGYRLSDNFAVEAQFATMGESTIRYRGASGAIGTEKYKVSAMSVAAMGLLPLNNDFTLFAKLGPSYTNARSTFSNRALGANTKSSRAGLLLGAGAMYNLTDNLALRAEFENYSRVGEANKAGRSTVSMVSAGLTYRF